jgi:phosphoglycerate dehydrogenase-like enzyme
MEAGMEHAAIDHHLLCECLLHKHIPFMGYDIFEPETLPIHIFLLNFCNREWCYQL